MSDLDLMKEAQETARIFSLMAASHRGMAFAIEAHQRGLGVASWGHLFDMAFFRDEARALFAAAAKR